MKMKKLRSRSPSTSVMFAILQILGGGCLSIFFTVSYIISRVATTFLNPPSLAPSLMLAFLFLSALLLCKGIWNCVLNSRYHRIYRVVVAKNKAATVKQISEELSSSPASIFAELSSTLNSRYWSGYGLTDSTLVLADHQSNSGTILSGPDMVFSESTRRNRGCLVAFGATWIIGMIFSATATFPGLIATSVVSVLVLLLSAAILPKEIVLTQTLAKEEEYKPEPVKTGDGETDDLLKEAQGYYTQLIALDKAINDEKLDKPVREILDITRQIIEYVKKAPEKSKQIRQFVKYYLPTTIKLLKNYDELSRQPVKGENIKESISKIEGVMDGILFTFRQQLDDLYQDQNIDISADVAVMENMINQDDVLSSK